MSEIFNKGSAMVRMLTYILGEDTFRRGLKVKHLRKNF